MSTIVEGFTKDSQGRWVIDKDPDDALYYGRDLTDRFPGRTIAGVVVAASSGVTAATPGFSGLTASVLVSGGTAGQTGYVTLRCTLDNGEISDRTLYFNLLAK